MSDPLINWAAYADDLTAEDPDARGVIDAVWNLAWANPNDSTAIDAIAALLGGSDEWSGADFLEYIGSIIDRVRPGVGKTGVLYMADLVATINARAATC